MRYASSRGLADEIDFSDALLGGLATDGGLYLPTNWPSLPLAEPDSYPELAAAVMQPFVDGVIDASDFAVMVADAYATFSAPDVCPLVQLDENHPLLELFHGPTLAFKDFGARFMARLMGWLTREDEELLTVLVATSGDTGGAVASAFHNVPGTRVVILYPKGKVSDLQEKQLTTLGGNITSLEVDGTFDDCQRLVKSTFLKREMAEDLNLTSANSINISRLVPQSFYYFEAARKLPHGVKPTFVIPSGNFGNLTAGLLAEKLGLEVERFVAATNRNDVIPAYLQEGEYRPRPSVATISNAMDVGAPSNFARMEDIFGNEWKSMRARVAGFSYDDQMTREAIRRIKVETGYTLEPHGAVGWLAAEEWRKLNPEAQTVVLETAHPAKFLDVMEEELGEGAVAIPKRLGCLANLEKVAIPMAPDEEVFVEWLRSIG